MGTERLTVAALCAGYGGLELGLGLAGVDCELSWFAEIDSHASQVMAHHNPDAPNLGDLTTIVDPPKVDVVTAGFPCQPVSMAGKRRGVNDERWLIDNVCRVARDSGARWLVLENVGGLLSANGGNAMARVVAALAANGFSAEWTCVRASDVGAPHQRLRWFCVAYATGAERRGPQHELLGAPAGPTAKFRERNRAATSDPAVLRRDQSQQQPGDIIASHGQRAAAVSDRHCSGIPASRWGPYGDAVARWEPIVGRPAPEPTDNKRRLNPMFVEWMMGLPEGWVTDVVPARSHQLRILGNGVVPQQAAYALGLLAGET